VIDPEAFGQTLPNRYKARQRAALAKAAQIIAMQAPAVGGEAVEIVTQFLAWEDGWHGWTKPAHQCVAAMWDAWPEEDTTWGADEDGDAYGQRGKAFYRERATRLLAALPSTAVGGGQEPVKEKRTGVGFSSPVKDGLGRSHD
jgi:hypothetical protein